MSSLIDRRIKIFTNRFEYVAQKRGFLSFGSKLWWTYRHKGDIEKLHPQMESLRSYLSLVFDALQINILLAMKATPLIKKKMYVYSQIALVAVSSDTRV
jgi:hypothetical protein